MASQYHDQTARAYSRLTGVSEGRAHEVVREWYRLVNKRSFQGKSPRSTAKHIAKFRSDKSACPCGSGNKQRDCACFMAHTNTSSSRDASRDAKMARRPAGIRKDAGKIRKSAKGIKFTVCPRGMRLQALLFPKGRYTLKSAKSWAQHHDHRVLQVEDMTNFIRIRVFPSQHFVKGSFRVIQLKGFERHGIRGYVACPRLALVKRKAARLMVTTTRKRPQRLKRAA